MPISTRTWHPFGEREAEEEEVLGARDTRSQTTRDLGSTCAKTTPSTNRSNELFFWCHETWLNIIGRTMAERDPGAAKRRERQHRHKRQWLSVHHSTCRTTMPKRRWWKRTLHGHRSQPAQRVAVRRTSGWILVLALSSARSL